MKILYIGNDAHDAEVTAFALQRIAPGVAIAWIPSLKAARSWIEQNPDVAVLTVEVNPDPAACTQFIGQIRALGVTAPLVLVAGGSVRPAPPALETLADATLPKNAALLHDLPITIGRLLKDQPSQALPEPLPPAPVRPAPPPPKASAESPRSNPFAHLVPAPDVVEQQLRQAVATLEQAHQDREALAAINVELERRVADATAALERAESRHAADMRDAVRLSDERAHANERSSQASAALDALRAELVDQASALLKAEQQVAVDRQAAAAAEAAHAAAEKRHASERDVLAAELADQNDQIELRVAETAAAEHHSRRDADALDALRSELAALTAQASIDRQAAIEATATHHAVVERQTGELARSAARLEEVQRQAGAQLAQAAADTREREARERSIRQAAERDAAAAGAAHAAAEERRQSELDVLTAELAGQKQQFEQRAAEAGARQEALRSELADADARLTETAAAAEHRSRQNAEALERQTVELARAAARLEEVQSQTDAQLAQAAANATEREARLEATVREESAKRETSENELTQARAQLVEQAARETSTRQAAERAATAAEAAHAAAQEQRASELAGLTAGLADQKQQFEQRLAEAAASAMEREARLDARLRDESARRETSENELVQARAQLVDQAAALQTAEQQAAVDHHAAAEDAARRQARQEVLTAGLADQKQQFEQRLTEAAGALDALQAKLIDATEREARLEATLREESAKRETSENELVQARARLVDQATRETSTRQAAERAAAAAQAAQAAADEQHASALEAVRSALAALTAQASIDRQAAIEATATQHAVVERLEAGLREESAKRETSEHDLVQARAAAEQAQRRFVDASNEMRERAREHALHLEERTARERAEWEGTLAERQERVAQLQRDGDLVRQSLASKEKDIKRLQTAHDEQRGRFDRARAAADADLTRLREECTAQQATLEDHRRQFDASPVSVCRVAADGTVTQASRALAKLLGYTSSEPLVKGGVAVFDSGDELKWLIDRCLSSRSTQSIETTWKKKDGSRIVVRLAAAASSAGCIDLAAEDITNVRELEEKLRHAQRLEAVARYASEVAGTCENLLRDVERAGPQWLSLIENASTRQQGERLLADVIRVSGFLRQLAEYGGKQKQALPLVEVNSVLRDLASVLKRVAGDHIELVLPAGSKPLNLDVETEHVERIFVNIAAYARARMPLGGRLLIDVAPAIVDRQFTEKYPSVRPGDHVLFTVTEVKGAALSTTAGILGSNGRDGHDTPGVDLGMLQSLVANCGGHLWIAAEPSGDMILKIHLPRRVLDDRAATTGAARWLSRLAAVTRH